MAIALGFERGILEYHLDRLRAAKLADITGFLDDDSHWAITAEGRPYVVDRKLIGGARCGTNATYGQIP